MVTLKVGNRTKDWIKARHPISERVLVVSNRTAVIAGLILIAGFVLPLHIVTADPIETPDIRDSVKRQTKPVTYHERSDLWRSRGKAPLTSSDAIETTRFRDEQVSISPNGKRFIARLVRGDVERNGYWLDLVSGKLDSLDAAASLGPIAHLFSTGLGNKDYPVLGPDTDAYGYNPIRWIDNDRVAFLWSDSNGIRQIVSLDTLSGLVEQITDAKRPIGAFDISPDGTTIYGEMIGRQEGNLELLVGRGFALKREMFGYDALLGRFADDGDYYDATVNSKWFIRSVDGRLKEIAIGGRSVDITPTQYRTVNFSPDGQRVIVSGLPAVIPDDWDRYVDPMQRERIQKMRKNPRAPFARRAIQLYVVNASDGNVKPLWSASATMGVPAVWSPDSRSVLLVPTFLPADATDPKGLAGKAAAIVDVSTGAYRTLPVDLGAQRSVVGAGIAGRWLDDHTIELTLGVAADARSTQHVFSLMGESWSCVGGTVTSPSARPGVRVEIRQDLNKPPRLVAVDTKTLKEKVVLDPNPQLLDRFELARTDILSGEEDDGVKWTALIIHPTKNKDRRKYPLVIQVGRRNFGPNEFTLYDGVEGGNLGPPMVPVSPGQLLAQRQVVVATVTGMRSSWNGTLEGPTQIKAFEAVIRRLASTGLIDPTKVGLVGYSRAGFWVQYVLTHSSFPYAAAISADNFDPSYLQTALTNWRVESDEVIGEPPFGPGLQKWLTEAPGFNAEKVRSPLLMIGQSPGLREYVVSHWEMFSRLQYLKKPVEMYLMPRIDEHPSHGTQNPGQILAVLNRTIDWFDFWLNSTEDPDITKKEQYVNWRRLRDLTNVAATTHDVE